MLDIIQKLLIPAVSEALGQYGVVDPDMALSRLIGAEVGAVQDEALRQQLTLQVFYPVALTLLKEYENYLPQQGAAERTRLLGTLLPDSKAVSADVLRYFAKGVAKAKANDGGLGTGFDLLAVPVRVNFKRLHESFLKDQMEITKPIKALCEIAYLYDCDVLLLSGRPSRLPGVQALFRGLLALPPNRVIGLHGYRTGAWYPFHRNGCIDDPKTAAAVGAMLCMLGQGQIPNFFFRANAFKLYSTVRHIGLMDNSQTIHDEVVYYRDVDFDNPDYQFPADEVSFEVRGRMKLGFRQLATSRWGASPLYLIDVNAKARAGQDLYGKDEAMVLKVSLKLPRRGDPRKIPLQINTVSRSDGGMQPAKDSVSLRFCTLLTRGMGETSYWLDSGSIKR